MREILNLISLFIIPFIVSVILIHGIIKKVPCYNVFVEGAKEGLFVAIKILPYLVAIMISIAMFRASGSIELIQNLFKAPLEYFKIPVETIPLMITRSLSGSATLGILSDIVNQTGVESYASKLSAIIVGSSETTLYVLAVYFGAVGIKNIRYALIVGLLADLFGIIFAVFIASYFFG